MGTQSAQEDVNDLGLHRIERIERSLGLLVGTVASTGVFITSFFLLFGSEIPPGLGTVFVTATVIVALIPGLAAGLRLALNFRISRDLRHAELDRTRIIKRSIWTAITINAIYAGIGIVASMGMLIVALVPYLLVASVLLAGVAALLGWGTSELVSRLL